MTGPPLAPLDTRAQLHGAIRSILTLLDPALIVDHRALEDLGADSIDRVEIVTGALDRLELNAPLSAFSSCRTIGEVIARLDQLRGIT